MLPPLTGLVHPKKDAEQTDFLGLRCVYASGILISSILPFLKRITQVYLHFGQNRGNSSNTVRGNICVLVLPPHLGQQSQSDFALMVLYRLCSLTGQCTKGRITIKNACREAGNLLDGLANADAEAGQNLANLLIGVGAITGHN